MAAEMDKFEKFIKEYEGTSYDALPKFIKRRVDALKKIQLDHIHIQHQYNMRLQELEMEYEKLYQPLYEKRAKIISGEYEPTEDECQLPANIAQNGFNGDQDNSLDKLESILAPKEEEILESQVKGIPGFWLGCLSSTYNFSDSIEPYDRPVLRYLKDIRLNYDQKGDCLTYKLEFVFDENPYFTNEVLTKTYYLKSNPDEKNPFNYEGFEVVKSEGCEIHWRPNKDVTTRTVTVRQKNKTNGTIREKKKEVERDSFFYFFKPPQLPEGDEEVDEELGAIVAVDFELGEMIRQSIIPKATLYYSGHLLDDDEDEDDEDEEDDEEEDDDDDDDDDDEEESDAADYESEIDESDDSAANHESTDSLVKKGPKQD